MNILDRPIAYLIILMGMTTFRVGAMAAHDPAVLRYEEYVVEHEISATQAKNVALRIDTARMDPPPGCQPCTSAERKYCLSGDFINDHCCCDRRHHEYLDFIPHTCYVGTVLCQTIAADCAEYSRLRTCCCSRLVLQKCKYKP